MQISPDQQIFWQLGVFSFNATILFTWIVMALLVIVARIVTWNLSDTEQMSRWQNLLEVLVTGMRDQIRGVSQQDPRHYLPFIGTLFLFIVTANVLSVVPGFQTPTASLSTPIALAIAVFIAVPVFGIRSRGLRDYLRQYVRPSPFMLPFNLIGEVSRTVALAVRLFGNMMSGSLIVAILLSLAPLFFPVLMQGFGLLIGVIQAYVFAMLALVYIASATRLGGAGPRSDNAQPTAMEASHG